MALVREKFATSNFIQARLVFRKHFEVHWKSENEMFKPPNQSERYRV